MVFGVCLLSTRRPRRDSPGYAPRNEYEDAVAPCTWIRTSRGVLFRKRPPKVVAIHIFQKAVSSLTDDFLLKADNRLRDGQSNIEVSKSLECVAERGRLRSLGLTPAGLHSRVWFHRKQHYTRCPLLSLRHERFPTVKLSCARELKEGQVLRHRRYSIYVFERRKFNCFHLLPVLHPSAGQ